MLDDRLGERAPEAAAERRAAFAEITRTGLLDRSLRRPARGGARKRSRE